MPEAVGEGAVHVETAVPEPGKTLSLDVEGTKILVCNVAGELFAIRNQCTHARVELTVGRMIDAEIECPVHGARFDVRSGAVTCAPARRALQTYPVERVDGGLRIQVD